MNKESLSCWNKSWIFIPVFVEFDKKMFKISKKYVNGFRATFIWKSINGDSPIDSVNITQVLLEVSGRFHGSNLILLDRK